MEKWIRVKEYSDYEVSNYGRIRSCKNGKKIVLKPFLSNNNYYVTLSKNNVGYNVRPSVLVLKEFFGIEHKRCNVIFIDNNRENARISNIYVTNGLDGIQTRFINNELEFVDIIKLYLIINNSGLSIENLYNKYKIDTGLLYAVINKNIYGYITDMVDNYMGK